MMIDNKIILENSKKLKVLYVEDDEQLKESTRKLFLNYFSVVDTAEDGLEGLEKYISHFDEVGEYYDLVISDISMPNMDGLLMSEKIRNICIQQAIILITAHDEISFLHSGIDIGVEGFLTKPVELEEIKKVLYTTTQKIADSRLVKNHYKQIEDSNILTKNLIDATELNSSKDILDKLIQDKDIISKIWMKNEIIHERLKSHIIDVEFFRSHYGIKVIEYFLNVINGDEKVGNCPVIIEMIEFFKHKNLPLEDIFMICVLFKNTVTAYIFERYSYNQQLFNEISYILDKNFEGVIINYQKMKSNNKQNLVRLAKSLKNKEIKVDTVEVKTPVVVEAETEVDEEINYIEYVMDNDIYELQDLEDDIDNLAVAVTMSGLASVEEIESLGYNIKRYGNVLSNYPIFTELGDYISKLGLNLSKNAQLLLDDKERMSNITTLIEGFVNDLIIWRKEIFDNNIADHRFLNDSFFSNVDTIIMFIEYDESATDNESFDDDMFF